MWGAHKGYMRVLGGVGEVLDASAAPASAASQVRPIRSPVVLLSPCLLNACDVTTTY